MPASFTRNRLSLNLSSGPRPLHLLDRSNNNNSAQNIVSPTNTSPSDIRRHSSISYRRSDPTVVAAVLNDDDSSVLSVVRPPLTLAEKHSELLHHIAQKEALCLELRSQLSIHQLELTRLKHKWEQIVNNDALGCSSPSSDGPGVVFEGIKEGVQGVGRLFAAGLSIAEPPSASSTSSRPSPLPLPHSSNSSPIPKPLTPKTLDDPPVNVRRDEQILMVHDTGATPTVSPNPAFEHHFQQHLHSRQTQEFTPPESPSTTIRRRKSRNQTPPSPLTPSDKSNSPLHAKGLEPIGKRASIYTTDFPPIPGLASLTVGATVAPPLSSWVESVGKKWDELQRGNTFSKKQKRASTLLSDFSHTIVSALSSPPTATSPLRFDLASSPQLQPYSTDDSSKS